MCEYFTECISSQCIKHSINNFSLVVIVLVSEKILDLVNKLMKILLVLVITFVYQINASY